MLEEGITCFLPLYISFLDFLIPLHHLDDILVSGNTGHVCSIPQYLIGIGITYVIVQAQGEIVIA